MGAILEVNVTGSAKCHTSVSSNRLVDRLDECGSLTGT